MEKSLTLAISPNRQLPFWKMLLFHYGIVLKRI